MQERIPPYKSASPDDQPAPTMYARDHANTGEVRFANPVQILEGIHQRKSVPEAQVESAEARLRQKMFDFELRDRGSVDIPLRGGAVHIEYEPNPTGFSQSRLISRIITEISGQQRDLLEMMPGYKIVWKFSANTQDGSSSAPDNNHKRLDIIGDFSQPMTLVVLCHEIGHGIDNAVMNKIGRTDLLESRDPTGVAEILRREHAATDYSIELLRPLLSEQQLKDAQLVMEHGANGLKSYYDLARDGKL